MPVAAPQPPRRTRVLKEKVSLQKAQEMLRNRLLKLWGPPSSESVVVTFGRFNPPTTGHEKLLKSASAESERSKSDFRIYPSRSVDSKKNPLQCWN